MSSTINGFDAILVKGTPRFRLNKKMVPALAVPDEVKQRLTEELLGPKQETVVPPSPAEIQQTVESIPVEAGIQPLAAEDFDSVIEDIMQEDVEPNIPTKFEMELIAELEDVKRQLAESTAGSVHSSLPSLASEMYQRYGVYTIFAGVEPKVGDINPLSGIQMNRYEMGLAYRSFSISQRNGSLDKDFSAQNQSTQQSREAEQAHAAEVQRRQEEPNFDQPKHQSFAERTSVEGQNRQASTRMVNRTNDPISEEATVEPENGVRGQTIRPVW